MDDKLREEFHKAMLGLADQCCRMLDFVYTVPDPETNPEALQLRDAYHQASQELYARLEATGHDGEAWNRLMTESGAREKIDRCLASHPD